MSRPGAYNPSMGEPFGLVVTAATVCKSSGFRISVSTAGSLFVRYADSDEICELPFGTGVSHEPGNFKQIWKDASIITNPVDTIVKYGG